MRARLDGLGVRWAFFEAIDAEAMPRDAAWERASRGSLQRLGRRLLPTEVACNASHRRACEHIAEGSEAFGCVLEDDVVLDPRARRVLDVSWLSSLPPFDVLRLHRTASRFAVRVGGDGEFDVRAAALSSWGMIAQVYSRTGAARAARLLEDASVPCDHALFLYAHPEELRVLELAPPVARPAPEQDTSTIDPASRRGGRLEVPLHHKVRVVWGFGVRDLRRLRTFVAQQPLEVLARVRWDPEAAPGVRRFPWVA